MDNSRDPWIRTSILCVSSPMGPVINIACLRFFDQLNRLTFINCRYRAAAIPHQGGLTSTRLSGSV
jgi:hypothetical protein